MEVANPVRDELTGQSYVYYPQQGCRPGDQNVNVCGMSPEKIVPPIDETFETISSHGLAHWLCYQTETGTFPYDPAETSETTTTTTAAPRLSATGGTTSVGAEEEIVKYYRFIATELCVAQSLLENKGKDKVVDESWKRARARTSQGMTTTTSSSVDQKASSEHRSRRCFALRIYLEGSTHNSFMHVLTMCNILTLTMYGMSTDTKGKFEDVLDITSLCFLIFGFIEIILRIASTGWLQFWYVSDDFFQQSSNYSLLQLLYFRYYSPS